MNIRRLRQVWHYANKDSLELQNNLGEGCFYRLNIFIDMIYSYLKYNIWTNQYLKEEFYNKSSEEKLRIGLDYNRL